MNSVDSGGNSSKNIANNVHRYFATGVGLVTTNGSKYGSNVMAAEWTMQISYEPMLIGIFVHESPTFWNIEQKKEFGINMASEEQAELVNIAGGYSGTEIKKLNIPKTFDLYDAKYIDVSMIRGCSVNAECKVTSIQRIGDHIMVVGKVLKADYNEKKFPLIYCRGNYRSLSLKKIPSDRKIVRITDNQFSKLKRLSKGKFVLKAAVASVYRGKKVLLAEDKSIDDWMLPFVLVEKGNDYSRSLKQHLRSLGINAEVEDISGIKRILLRKSFVRRKSNFAQQQNEDLRANFILFRCKPKSLGNPSTFRWFNELPKKSRLLRALTD